jgi:hypothetical protein
MGPDITGQVQSEDAGESLRPAQRRPWRAPVLGEFAAASAGSKTLAGASDGVGGKFRYS